MNSSVLSDFLNCYRDVEERIASCKLFQTDVAAAENNLPPPMARLFCEMTRMVLDAIAYKPCNVVGGIHAGVLSTEGGHDAGSAGVVEQ